MSGSGSKLRGRECVIQQKKLTLIQRNSADNYHHDIQCDTRDADNCISAHPEQVMLVSHMMGPK